MSSRTKSAASARKSASVAFDETLYSSIRSSAIAVPAGQDSSSFWPPRCYAPEPGDRQLTHYGTATGRVLRRHVPGQHGGALASPLRLVGREAA